MVMLSLPAGMKKSGKTKPVSGFIVTFARILQC
jgi:hypothetical protein